MALISTTEANQALATTGWGFISLHTASPSTTGANEVTGGTYARVAVTWAAASGGSVSNNGSSLSINLPTGVTATHFGVWSASSAGTYYLGGALTASVGGGSAATVTIAAGAITVSAS
jgi:hypothetical protein